MHSLVRDNRLESDIGTRKNDLFYKNRNSTGSLGIHMDWSAQIFFSIFVALIFFIMGAYSLITGKMKTDPTGVNKGVVVTGIKARVMGLLLIILAFLISLIGIIT